ncbi:MAG: NADP-dependent oxidoreductase [Planctomycetes bacterium]|nr:NADP-dependent oxidoreductase [Planctomycetota bacterium]
MKAVRIHAYGKADVLVYEDAPRPEPKPNEVLVKIHAAGINPVDWKIREGAFGKSKSFLPRILGGEIAGTIASCGADVQSFKPGDEVWALLSLTRMGGYAEFVCVPEKELARKPKSMDFVHAAGVPLAALTAWQALVDTAGLKEGQSVLIHAGAGGVGHFAIQIAKARGAKVYATASANHLEFLKRMGADVAIDYKAQKFEDVARDMDVVFDMIGGETQARSFACLKKGGFLVSIVQPPDAKKLEEFGVKGAIFLVKQDVEELDLLAKLLEAKQLVCEVSETVPLAEAQRAHELSETGHTQGKIVLQVVK